MKRTKHDPKTPAEPYTPPQCTESSHLSPIVRFTDKHRKVRSMSCQACGSNWEEAC